jgi:hypothetical protein
LVKIVQKQWDEFLSNPLPMCDFADDLKSDVIENVLSEREFESRMKTKPYKNAINMLKSIGQ